jgi:hypothetical protein
VNRRTVILAVLLLPFAANSAHAATELRGMVRVINGRQITLVTSTGEVIVWVPAGTVLKVGDRITVTVQRKNDMANFATSVVVNPS